MSIDIEDPVRGMSVDPKSGHIVRSIGIPNRFGLSNLDP